MNQRHKKGIALLEVVIAITIMTAISAIALLAGTKILRSSDITSIIAEYKMYSSAISMFYASKNRMPGDIMYEEMVGNLNNTILKDNNTYASSTCINTTDCIMGNNHIGGVKGLLAFQQMAVANFLSNSNISKEYIIPSSNLCTNGANIYNAMDNLLPKSSYSKKSAWTIAMDSSAQSIQNQLGPRNSIIYNPNIYQNFQNKPRLILFNYSNYSLATNVNCAVDVNYQNSSFQGSGIIPADMAAEIDMKIDDGKAMNGMIIGEKDWQGNGLVCIDSFGEYTNSTSQAGRNACIMIFALNISA